jgi:hypothetical protein
MKKDVTSSKNVFDLCKTLEWHNLHRNGLNDSVVKDFPLQAVCRRITQHLQLV